MREEKKKKKKEYIMYQCECMNDPCVMFLYKTGLGL